MTDLQFARNHIGLVPDFVMDTTEKSGIDFFSASTVDQLFHAGNRFRFTLFVTKKRLKEFSTLPSDVRVLAIPEMMGAGFPNILWYLFVLPFQAYWYRIDLLHLFAGNRRMTWFSPKRTLTTVHDVFHFHQKDLYTFPKYVFFRYVVTPLLKRQKHFHAISKATKKEMEIYLGLAPESIHVAHLGLPRWRSPYSEPQDNARKQLCLDRPYMLYVSSLDHPRKNHLTLLDAYELLLSKRAHCPDLVFAGPDFFHSEVIHDEIKRRNLSNRVKAVGYVPDSLMPSLYQEATLFLHPSKLEGFGYPLVEAMMYGVPVACADIDVFREIGGDVPLYFNPSCSADIVAKIEMILGDVTLQQDLSGKGLKRAEAFCLNRSFSEIMKIYERILSGRLPASAQGS